ncbi:MAG: DUF4248 domain-containing protein, partial [Bacteroidales bacterium]|nr:DUF4248 domain-containing protein [Bacteroidales bacterium]
MKTVETEPKILRMFYSIKELAAMMDTGYNTFRRELRRNSALYTKLSAMGWSSNKRLCKAHVLEIFKVLGYPDGYEHYE